MAKDACAPHELTKIISGHTDALIALGAKYMGEYHISDPSKCLNSAVSLLFLLLGKDALENTKYCDVTTVTKRYEQDNPSLEMARGFSAQLKQIQPVNTRDIYYCMITDAWLSHSSKPGVQIYMPGHVFVIERTNETHSIFQSYIKQYDLDEYITRTAQRVRNKQDLDALADGVVTLFSKRVWDRDCTDFWRGFTMIDSKNFEGFEIKDKIFFCYRRIPLEKCVGSLRMILAKTQASLKNSRESDYFSGQKRMTNGQMARHLKEMLKASM